MSEVNMNQPKGIDMQFTKYQESLDLLVKTMKEDQPKLERLTDFKNYSSFCREHRTIHFGGGRQTGKTFWGLRRSDSNTIFFAMTEQLVENHEFVLEACNGSDEAYQPLVISRMAFWTYHRRQADDPKRIRLFDDNKGRFKQVIVDDASFFFDNHSRKSFYEAIQPICHEDVIFIFLG